MRRLFILVFFIACVTQLIKSQKLSFCVQAHQDDWQLFNSKNIVSDLHNGKKVVFITLTAGDAGNGDKGNGAIPFFMAREKGFIYSVKFAQDLFSLPTPLPQPKSVKISYKNINGETISHVAAKYSYKNAESYFLRLPDGQNNGQGFPANKSESLLKLKNKEINSISAVDKSTTYADWTDLVNTIKQIIVNETEEGKQAWLYLNSTNTQYSQNEHKDHLHASYVVLDAVQDLQWIGITEWMSYHKAKKQRNVQEKEHENATALFAVYDWALMEAGYETSFNDYHRKWLTKDYTRLFKNPIGYAGATKAVAETGKKTQIISWCSRLPQNKELLLRVNVFEKGSLTVKIFDISGRVSYNNNFVFEDYGVKDIPITAELTEKINIVTVVLNGKYIDSMKFM